APVVRSARDEHHRHRDRRDQQPAAPDTPAHQAPSGVADLLRLASSLVALARGILGHRLPLIHLLSPSGLDPCPLPVPVPRSPSFPGQAPACPETPAGRWPPPAF